MDDIKDFFTRDHFAEHVGIELLEISEGTATARMDVEEFHLNGVRTVQGGAIFTLADLTFAAASNSHGTVAVAINANISFVKATTSGTLYAEAKETSVNHRIGTYTVTITNSQGDTVAIFEGMAYRKKQSIHEIID